MKYDITCIIMLIVIDIVAVTLIGVCNNFTVPTIAILITVILACVASWATYKMIKYWTLKLFKKWNLKRKQ